jgi:Nucleotidyltransferase domain
MESVKALALLLAETTRKEPAEVRDVINSSNELVIFGSSAYGVRTRHSDLDVLCLTTRAFHYKNRRLDLLCLSNKEIYCDDWLGGELASHVKTYGVWLKHQSAWIDQVALSRCAVLKKQRRLTSYTKALSVKWSRLDEIFRHKYTVKLRREMQRLLLLEQDAPTPPTKLLDDKWHFDEQHADEISKCVLRLFGANAQGLSEDFEKRLEIDRHDFFIEDKRHVPQAAAISRAPNCGPT